MSSTITATVIGGAISSVTSVLVLVVTQAREARRIAISNMQKIYTDVLIPKLFEPLLQERIQGTILKSRNYNFAVIYRCVLNNVAYFPMLKTTTAVTLEELLAVTKEATGTPGETELVRSLLEDLYFNLQIEFRHFRGENVLWEIGRNDQRP